jgi:hypothetical protein
MGKRSEKEQAMTVVNGREAIRIAKESLPAEVQSALDRRLPLRDVTRLCAGHAGHEELARKCYDIWAAAPEYVVNSTIALHYS